MFKVFGKKNLKSDSVCAPLNSIHERLSGLSNFMHEKAIWPLISISVDYYLLILSIFSLLISNSLLSLGALNL